MPVVDTCELFFSSIPELFFDKPESGCPFA
jgi:hypothetical protein